MWSGKHLKASARKSFKHNYWRCVIVCLILAFVTGMFIDPLQGIRNLNSKTIGPIQITYTGSEASKDIEEVQIEGLTENAREDERSNTDILRELFEGIKTKYIIKDQDDIQQTYKGAIGFFVNNINASNSILFGIMNSFNQIFFNGSVGAGIIILFGVFISIAFWMFIQNIIRLGGYRFFIENHMYYSTDLRRMLLPYRVKRLWKQARTMLLKTVYQVLWSLTIVGAFVKPFSYLLVPYITAENPDVETKTAFSLSKRMMQGNKWKSFLLYMSFVPWKLLSIFTLGMVNTFYVYPYQTATFAELYFALRRKAIDDEIEDYEVFNDALLDPAKDDTRIFAGSKVVDPFDDHSEVPIFYSVTVDEGGAHDSFTVLPEGKIAIGVGADYMDSYFTLPVYYSNFFRVDVIREYSLLTYILFFFTFAMAGWIWEVSLHLFTNGEFVNRGTMFGPWLPIYGVGATLAVLLLHKFVKNPMEVFFTSFVLSGVIEYATATFLWYTKGMKWWDYTGNFANIQGRICLEGLLVFAIGCMAVLYFIGPQLDEIYKRINKRIKIVVAVVLICIFSIDLIYSYSHPNMGEGITTVSMAEESNADSLQSDACLYSNKI